MKPITVLHLCLFLVLCATSCSRAKVATYRIPKEKDAVTEPTAATSAASAPSPAMPGAAAAPMASASSAMATAAGPGLTWTAPAAWPAKAAGAMRKGSYSVPGEGSAVADLSITAFPGDVGGEVANVNRWRGQLQLAPVSEAEVAASVTRLQSNALNIAVVDLANRSAATPTRLLGAMIPYGGATWFFKLLGPDALVVEARPAFLEFLKTIAPAAAASTP